MIYLSFFILRASVQLQKLNSKQYHYRVKSNTSQCAKKSQIAGWTVNCLLRQKFCINSCRVEICTRFASTSGGLDKPSRAFEPTTEVFDSLILRDFHRPKKPVRFNLHFFLPFLFTGDRLKPVRYFSSTVCLSCLEPSFVLSGWSSSYEILLKHITALVTYCIDKCCCLFMEKSIPVVRVCGRFPSQRSVVRLPRILLKFSRSTELVAWLKWRLW